jgi:hypothetical protein
MIRLHQRKGKKLIMVNQPESGFNRFADELHDTLDTVNAEMNMLFIYNINHTSEEAAYAIWKKAEAVNTCECNVLMTSDYPNLTGMLALGITAIDKKADFVIGYGAYPEGGNAKAFKVAVTAFFDEKAPVDLLLPQPTYLETEGTAMANAGIVAHYKNPTRSNAFHQILKAMYELGWISPAFAEPVYWNQKAEEFIKASEMLTTPDKLNPEKYESGFTINSRLEELFSLRSVKQGSFPKSV